MKSKSKFHKPKGFTLIELLVVIAIIAVLAALGGGAAVKAINKARETTALSATNQVDQAVQSFYDEYAAFPSASKTFSGGGADEITDTSTGEFLNHLLGAEKEINKKGIRFLNIKEAKGKRGGIVYDASGKGQLFDPWGQPYFVVLDSNFDDEIKDPVSSEDSAIVRGRKALIYSSGRDKRASTNKDNVYSWK